MAKSCTYHVSFSPAERTPHGYLVRFAIGQPDVRHTVVGDLAALEAAVRRLAVEYGRTCSPYIRQPKGDRAVPGFRALCDRLRIIDVAEFGVDVERALAGDVA